MNQGIYLLYLHVNMNQDVNQEYISMLYLHLNMKQGIYLYVISPSLKGEHVSNFLKSFSFIPSSSVFRHVL